MNESIQKYLSQYAEVESRDIAIEDGSYDCVIVIPICNEVVGCLNTVFSEISEKNLLIVVVVNSPKDCKDENWKLNNKLFINDMHEKSNSQYYLNNNSHLLKYKDFSDVLLIDRNSDGWQINSKKGVGLARKIGCDVALKLYVLGIIKCPWIFSTDADVILPKNYFNINIQKLKGFSALVLDFLHFSDDEELNKLQAAYDFKLRYYQTALCYANSPYNYIPLGSTIVVNMLAYAQVRGFPKKNAGEDFYLLNKLAKIKPIKYKYDGTVVKIKSRFSNRVPFGTGPALSKIQTLQSLDHYSYYNPQCFIYLKKWQDYLDTLYSNNCLDITPPVDHFLLELYLLFDCYRIFNKSKPQITSCHRWSQFVLQWFDAFRTLKAVHCFDKKFPQLNYKQLLKSEYFAKVTDSLLEK